MSEDNLNMDTTSSCSSSNDSDVMLENSLRNKMCDSSRNNMIQDRLNYNMHLVNNNNKKIETSVNNNDSSLNLSSKCLNNKNSGVNKFTIDNILGLAKTETNDKNSKRLDYSDDEQSEDFHEKSERLCDSNLSSREPISE